MPRHPLFDIMSFNPLKQGAFTMLLITLVSLLCFLFHIRSMQAWNMILSPIFLFSSYNPIIGAFQQKWGRYLAVSALVFVVLAMYIYISGNFVSQYSYRESDELHRFTALAIIFYFLLNLVCIMFRGVLYMLETIDE